MLGGSFDSRLSTNSKTIEVGCWLRRYVAPVEDSEGVSYFSLNSALKVRKVTGTVTLGFDEWPLNIIIRE